MKQMSKRPARQKKVDPNHLRKFRIHKGDTVLVLSGKDKGKTGVVRTVLTRSGKVIVDGINMMKKAVKPNPSAGITGGIVEMEASMPICKVMVMDLKTNKPTRIRKVLQQDAVTGKSKRIRVAAKSGEPLDL
jgi:large subunit ribosomal protein L24